MPRLYLDSSAILKRYLRETGSASVGAVYRAAALGQLTLCFSEWNIGEVLGVMQRKTRLASRPKLFAKGKQALHGETSSLSRMGFLEVAAVSSRFLRSSWRLLEKHQLYVGDALQIATSISQRCDAFLTADTRLLGAASQEGIAAYNVESDRAAITALVK